MAIDERTHYADRPWTRASQPWALDSAWCPPAAASASTRSAVGGWDVATVLVLLSLFLGCMAVVIVVQRLDLLRGVAVQRVQVCNRFDSSAVTLQCSASDPFIVVHHGSMSASLQVALSGAVSRSRTPVTISVTETNGAGLVIAKGSTRRMLQQSSAGVAVVPLQGVFTASGIPLAPTSEGSPKWERDAYEVLVREGTTVLGDSWFHIAL